MADTEKENVLGFVDKRRTQASTQTETVEDGFYLTVGHLRTRLSAINGAYYTSDKLNEMTKNDMVFALRTASDSAGI